MAAVLYSGLAENFNADVEIINTHSNRLCAVHVTNDSINLVLISVHMPCESSDIAFDEFCTVLAQIVDIFDLFHDAKIIIGGDFNTDFTRNATHSNFLRSFCDSHKLCSLASHNASRVDYI